METPGNLVSFVHEEYHIYKGGGFQYEMKYSLANTKGHVYDLLQLMRILQLAITSLTSLFTELIAVDGTLHNSKPSGMVKQLVVTMKMP